MSLRILIKITKEKYNTYKERVTKGLYLKMLSLFIKEKKNTDLQAYNFFYMSIQKRNYFINKPIS